MERVPPEVVPKLYFMLKALEEAPPSIRIVMPDGSVSFKSLVKWLRRRRRELFRALLTVYDCGSESCLSNSMSKTFRFWVEQHIAFRGQTVRAGEVYEAAREWIPRLYPVLPGRREQ